LEWCSVHAHACSLLLSCPLFPPCLPPQGQWNVKACKLPGASRIASWALVVLLPQGQADVEGPSGVVPFVADLRDSLRGMGLECEVPPIVYEQVGAAGSSTPMRRCCDSSIDWLSKRMWLLGAVLQYAAAFDVQL
jgi:hypothetical protein